MKKSILNLKGVQELTKTEQKMVFGKGPIGQPCEVVNHCYRNSPTGCINMCMETPKPRT
jgi:hypothetical protein